MALDKAAVKARIDVAFSNLSVRATGAAAIRADKKILLNIARVAYQQGLAEAKNLASVLPPDDLSLPPVLKETFAAIDAENSFAADLDN